VWFRSAHPAQDPYTQQRIQLEGCCVELGARVDKGEDGSGLLEGFGPGREGLQQQDAAGFDVFGFSHFCQDHCMSFLIPAILPHIVTAADDQNKWNTALIGLVTYYREAVISTLILPRNRRSSLS
jgi:hypothetical protein